MEKQGYERLAGLDFIPTIKKIDNTNLEIIFQYQPNNLNHLFYHKQEPESWHNDVTGLKIALERNNIFKINFYPHTFFYDNDKLKIFDLYACLHKNDRIKKSSIKDIIKDKKRFHFVNNFLDIEYTYNYTIENNYGEWPKRIL